MKTVLGLSLVGLGLENKQQETKVKQREKEFCLREREALWIEKKSLLLQDNNHKEVNIRKDVTLYHGDN